ncbi:MAG: hypothetical protein IJR52_04315 [Selenomonadaceae bacterium]|nr:hypothetical protein [Selenomonadaceae bacterium]
MPTIKKESSGEATIWTLRNTKGNELKVTDQGARVISMRFRDKDYKNNFLLKEDGGKVIVDGGEDFSKILWQAEQLIEGVKFTAQVGGKSVSVLYSVSNDNEISIICEASGVEDVSVEPIFTLPDAESRACQKGATWEKISDEKIYPVTQPAEVEMELGMFGYDPGCPIDYLDAGLKNAANIFSAQKSIDIIVYATQDKIHVRAVDGGFAIKASGSKVVDGKIKSQTVYMIKNRK